MAAAFAVVAAAAPAARGRAPDVHVSVRPGASPAGAAAAGWSRPRRGCHVGLLGALALLAARAAGNGRRHRRRIPKTVCRASRKAVDKPEDFSAISEYKALKGNFLGSWGFLDEDQFVLRMLGLFGVNALAGLVFIAAVYPPNSLANVAVDGLFGVAISFTLSFAILLFILRQWDMVNRMLRKGSYVVEGRSPDQRFGDGGAYAYTEAKSKRETRRDRLLAGYVTEPVVSRLRVYVTASLALSATSWAGGAFVGGEMSIAEEEEEEEQENGTFSLAARTGGRDKPGFEYFLQRG